MKVFDDKDYTYVKCPCCGADLQFLSGSAFAVAHLKKHEVDTQTELQLIAHPEVTEEEE